MSPGIIAALKVDSTEFAVLVAVNASADSADVVQLRHPALRYAIAFSERSRIELPPVLNLELGLRLAREPIAPLRHRLARRSRMRLPNPLRLADEAW